MKRFFIGVGLYAVLLATTSVFAIHQTVTFCAKDKLDRVSAGKITFAFRSKDAFNHAHEASIQPSESKCITHTYHGSPKRLMFYFTTSPISDPVKVSMDTACKQVFTCNTPTKDFPAYCYAKKKTFEEDTQVKLNLTFKDAHNSKSQLFVSCHQNAFH